MESVGLVASCITVLDLVVRAKKFCDKVKCAPDKWTRYCQELENLAHVVGVLNDMINTSDTIKRRTIEVGGGETEPLVKFMAYRIETIRKEALGILDRHGRLEKQSYKSRKSRVWEWFRSNMTAYKFVLDDQDIQHLIEAVEHAKSCLQSLLCLVHLESLESGQQQTQNNFRSIHENMKKHAEALEKLHRDKNLGQLTLQIVEKKGVPSYDHTRNRSSLSLRSSITESMPGPRFIQIFKEGGEKAKNSLDAVFRPSKRGHGRAHSCAGAGEGPSKKTKETTYEGGLEARADMDDAEDEHPDSDTNDEAIEDGHLSFAGSSGTIAQGKDLEPEYDLIYCNDKILTIATNTQEYKTLISESRGETPHPKSTRLHDALSPMPEEKRARCAESGPGELLAILSSAACSDVKAIDGERLDETCGGNLERADQERLEVTNKGTTEATNEERPEVIKEATLDTSDERTLDATRNTNPKVQGGRELEAIDEEGVKLISETTLEVTDVCPLDATNKASVEAKDEGAPRATDEVFLDATYEVSLAASATETVEGIGESTLEATDETAREGSLEEIDEATFGPAGEASLKATNEKGPEVTGGVTLIKIDLGRPNVVFVSATIDLQPGLTFCVGTILLAEPSQTILVQERCQDSCQHVTLTIRNAFAAQSTPYKATLQCMTCYESLEMADEADSPPNFTSKSVERCKDRSVCFHTVVEGFPVRQEACLLPGLLPVNIHAWPDDNGWESETSTEREASDMEEETFPSQPAQDDDMRAFVLIEAIKYETEGYDVPTEVPFDVLVEFLKLMDKYGLEEPYLARSRGWANALLPSIPTTLDQDAIVWLWVLWRLQISAEFEKLSGIVQKQAKCRIDEDPNTHGVELPERIVEAIDWRRVLALSKIRDRVTSLIEIFRQEYANGFAGRPPWRQTLTKISSATAIGYLTLESEACFSHSHTTGSADFRGVSFLQASRWARSLVDLGDWMVKPVPRTSIMPSLANLGVLVSVFGAGFREAEICTCLSSRVKEQLIETIEELEEEDWGFHLAYFYVGG